ncbi:zinc ribbon domain-containing protein [Oscillibacter sp.]|uniref:zinc ribbon domain-containing protein n=1 Tax=Oscillibacter sp. TaxID=1945593 RepID=UPI002619C086|nr:zinc ribbon domain-containing protein [Oscillibacter sp.]MDD3347580.1 zinc ribbon domain-containing protein [Oscillibacter sp.]
MNEKLYDLLEKVQSTAIQVSDTAVDAAYGVRKKAGELLSVAKLNIRVADRKAAVNTAFRELGEMLYATHTGTPTDSEDLLAKLEEVDALKAEIAALQTQIGKEAAAHLCPTCGAVIREDDQFCRECGGPL